MGRLDYLKDDIKDNLPLYLTIFVLTGALLYLNYSLRPQTRNVIGDPNKPEEYVTMPDGKKAYLRIDGKSVEDYVNERSQGN